MYFKSGENEICFGGVCISTLLFLRAGYSECVCAIEEEADCQWLWPTKAYITQLCSCSVHFRSPSLKRSIANSSWSKQPRGWNLFFLRLVSYVWQQFWTGGGYSQRLSFLFFFIAAHDLIKCCRRIYFHTQGLCGLHVKMFVMAANHFYCCIIVFMCPHRLARRVVEETSTELTDCMNVVQ